MCSFYIQITYTYRYIHYIYIQCDCWLLYFFLSRQTCRKFLHFLGACMCASPPKFLRPLGEIRMMANGGNQTAVTVAVCVQTVTRARRVAFSLPVHRRRLNNNIRRVACSAATVAPSHESRQQSLGELGARAPLCTYVLTVCQVRRGRRRNLIHAHVFVQSVVSRLFTK